MLFVAQFSQGFFPGPLEARLTMLDSSQWARMPRTHWADQGWAFGGRHFGVDDHDNQSHFSVDDFYFNQPLHALLCTPWPVPLPLPLLASIHDVVGRDVFRPVASWSCSQNLYFPMARDSSKLKHGATLTQVPQSDGRRSCRTSGWKRSRAECNLASSNS